jgi:hypothetical protein
MRITVYDDAAARRTMVGWFDTDRAVQFRPDPDCCLDCAAPDSGQWLYRTSLGRWVLCREVTGGGQPCYRFLSPTQAREWLIRHGRAEAAAMFASRRRAPAARSRRPGRPEVGGPVVVRLGADLLTDLDNYAGARNLSRANAIRDLIRAALTDAAPAAGDTGVAARSTCC